MVSTRRLATTLLALAVALGAAACQPIYVGPGGPKVAVVGDSITNSASTPIDGELTDRYRYIQGVDGIDLAEGRARLVKPVVASSPQVVVIELGINSARESWDSADLPHLEGVLADLRTVPCVVWVVPTALDGSYYDHLGEGSLQDRIGLFRASLEKRLPKHPNVHLADFAAIQLAHPEWHVADRLHLNAEGQAAYASFVAAAVAQHC